MGQDAAAPSIKLEGVPLAVQLTIIIEPGVSALRRKDVIIPNDVAEGRATNESQAAPKVELEVAAIEEPETIGRCADEAKGCEEG